MTKSHSTRISRAPDIARDHTQYENAKVTQSIGERRRMACLSRLPAASRARVSAAASRLSTGTAAVDKRAEAAMCAVVAIKKPRFIPAETLLVRISRGPEHGYPKKF